MIALTNTGLKIEVLMGANKTTNEADITATYQDIPSGNSVGGGPNGNVTMNTTGTTAVTVIPAPTQSVSREVQNLTVHNADTVSQTITVRVNNGTSTWKLFKATLATLETMVYSDGAWLCYTAAGEIKSNT